MARWAEQQTWIDTTVRDAIDAYFKCNRLRAFRELKTDMPIWEDFEKEHSSLVSLATFYKIMNGESANVDKIDRVELRWAMYERTYELPEVPTDHAGMKQWIRDHVGSFRIAHTTLFPDWPYSTMVASLQGHCKPDRAKVIHERLCAHRTAALEQRAIQNVESQRGMAEMIEEATKKGERNVKERVKQELRLLLQSPGMREVLEEKGRFSGYDLADLLGEDHEGHSE